MLSIKENEFLRDADRWAELTDKNQAVVGFLDKCISGGYKKINQGCLYFNRDNCKGKPIGSHSIHRGEILSRLAEKGHVQGVNLRKIRDNKIEIQIYKKGIKKEASVFNGFCSEHDDSVFAPIEKDTSLKVLDKKQQALFAYRAFAKELYETIGFYNDFIERIENQKDVILNAKSAIKSFYKEKPLNIDEQEKIESVLGLIEYLTPYYIITYRKMKEILTYNDIFKEIIYNKKYSLLETEYFIIDKEFKFTLNSMFSPVIDLENNILNDEYIPEEKRNQKDDFIRFKQIFMNIYPIDGQSIILISYLKEDKFVLKNYVKQLKKLSKNNRNQFLKYMNVLIPLHVENLFMNTFLWEGWKEEGQKQFEKLAIDTIGIESSNNIRNILKDYLNIELKYNLFH